MQLSVKNILSLPSKIIEIMENENQAIAKAGRVKMIPHGEVMREMEQLQLVMRIEWSEDALGDTENGCDALISEKEVYLQTRIVL